MSNGKGGFIGQDGLNAPDPATGVSASGGIDTVVNVSFTAPTDTGGAAITSYHVQDSTGTHSASGSESPIAVGGLSSGSSYTFNVWAINPFGYSAPSDATSSASPTASRAVFSGGMGRSNPTNIIDYVSIATTADAVDFGDLTSSSNAASGTVASSTRGLILKTGPEQVSNDIDYITIASTGNAVSFGEISYSTRGVTGLSNGTRGVFGGGESKDNIEYVTIASTGNSTNFGDLIGVELNGGSTCASPTRGLFVGGGSSSNVIQYITIDTTGNAIDFGDLTNTSNFYTSGLSNNTRGVIAGGGPTATNIIQYVTIASTGNATDFGDLLEAQEQMGGTANATRGLFAGGTEATFNPSRVIQYITIGSTGNATDFGDLISPTANSRGRESVNATSNAHGGLS
jgi:hypothetical protein